MQSQARNTTTSDPDRAHSSLSDEFENLKIKNEEQRKQIKILEANLKERDTLIASKDAIIADKDTTISRLEHEIGELRNQTIGNDSFNTS